MCVCEGGGEEGGWASCGLAAPRPTSQAGETPAHVGAPLTRHELVEASRAAGGAVRGGGRELHLYLCCGNNLCGSLNYYWTCNAM